MFSLLKSRFRSSVRRTHTNDEQHSKTPCPFSARPIVSRLTQINFCRFQTTDQFRLFVFVLFIYFFPCPMRNVSLYKRCPRRSVWSRPVNGKNWCTRIDALLTGLPAAAVERETRDAWNRFAARSNCAIARRAVQYYRRRRRLPPQFTVHFLFRSSPPPPLWEEKKKNAFQ